MGSFFTQQIKTGTDRLFILGCSKLESGDPWQKISNYGSWVTLELFGAINEEMDFTVATGDGNSPWKYQTFRIQFDRSQRYLLYVGNY